MRYSARRHFPPTPLPPLVEPTTKVDARYFLPATSLWVFSMNSLSKRSPSVSFGGGAVLPVVFPFAAEFLGFSLAVLVRVDDDDDSLEL